MRRTHHGSILALSLLLFTLGHDAAAECIGLAEERADYGHSAENVALHTKKIEYALSLINDKELSPTNQDCVVKAIQFLGTFQVHEAIPRLIELLGYRYNPIKSIKVMTSGQVYPAIGALIRIGEPAVPLLVRSISIQDENPDLRKNALDTLLSIYREDPQHAIAVLQKAADEESDPIRMQRLQEAVRESQNSPCRGSAAACERWGLYKEARQ